MASFMPALLLVLLTLSTPAAAQGIRRCVDAQGTSIFTDRPCSEMNAVPREDPAAGPGNLDSGYRTVFQGSLQGGFSQRSCARQPEDLLDRVRSALESRDVNRLAGQYHWTGTGSGSGKRLMDALERIAGQPLLSAELVYPEPPPEIPAPLQDPYAVEPAVTGPYDDSSTALYETAPAPAVQPRHIRVLQMRSERAEQATSTLFRLRRNAGCWWIEL